MSISLPFNGRQPALSTNQQHKAYDRAMEIRRRVENIGLLALQADNRDGVDLQSQSGKVVLSGADLRGCQAFASLPAGLFDCPDQAFSRVTGSVEIDPASGRVSRMEVELGQDRFGHARYSLETSGSWLGLKTPTQTFTEELPSPTGSYARGLHSRLEARPDEWLFSQQRLSGGGKTIF